jgi:myo-inositol-1(or 4)-monophosphatase
MALNLLNIVTQVTATALSTGDFIREESLSFDINRIETKGLHDFVSYVDIESEKRITSQLQTILPGAGFYTEEGTISKDDKSLRWIIDPLDGTTNFMHGLPHFSISIALEEDGEIVIGVVYIVSSNELFWAYKNGGAWLNGRKISVSAVEKVGDSLIGTGFPIQNFSRLDSYIKCLDYLIRNSHGVRRMGSAATDLAFVACGRFDAFYEYNLNLWDIAAGMLLVREAGGKVSDFSGSECSITGLETVASNRNLSTEFIEIVSRFMG